MSRLSLGKLSEDFLILILSFLLPPCIDPKEGNIHLTQIEALRNELEQLPAKNKKSERNSTSPLVAFLTAEWYKLLASCLNSFPLSITLEHRFAIWAGYLSHIANSDKFHLCSFYNNPKTNISEKSARIQMMIFADLILRQHKPDFLFTTSETEKEKLLLIGNLSYLLNDLSGLTQSKNPHTASITHLKKFFSSPLCANFFTLLPKDDKMRDLRNRLLRP